MSEKCYCIGCGGCSSNCGYGSSSPDECDKCGEYYCSKHMKLHRKDGTCEEVINENNEYELDELEKNMKNIKKKIKEMKKKLK